MERIFVTRIKKIALLRSKIEKVFNVKLNITSTHIEVEGKGEDGFSEYVASKAIEALDMGFSPNSAFLLKNEDYLFEKVDIKRRAKQSRVFTIKSRLIGRHGKAKQVLERLTDCDIEIKGHYVGVIGKSTDTAVTLDAINKLVQGSPHNKVYAFLERHQETRQLRKEEEENLSFKE